MKFGKMFLTLTMVATFGGLVAESANACISRVSQRKLFVVNMPGTEMIRAETGDMIRVTLSNPVVPGKVKTDFDAAVLRPVTSVDVTPEGRLGAVTKQYFFEVIGGGDSQIRMAFVGRNGTIVNGFVQEIQATQRPVSRGCN